MVTVYNTGGIGCAVLISGDWHGVSDGFAGRFCITRYLCRSVHLHRPRSESSGAFFRPGALGFLAAVRLGGRARRVS